MQIVFPLLAILNKANDKTVIPFFQRNDSAFQKGFRRAVSENDKPFISGENGKQADVFIANHRSRNHVAIQRIALTQFKNGCIIRFIFARGKAQKGDQYRRHA